MARNNWRGSNPTFGTPIPRIGQSGGSFYWEWLPSKRALDTNLITRAILFNKWVIE